MSDVEQIQYWFEQVVDSLADGVKVTLIIRLPGDDEADVLLTNEKKYGPIHAALKRAERREILSEPGSEK